MNENKREATPLSRITRIGPIFLITSKMNPTIKTKRENSDRFTSSSGKD